MTDYPALSNMMSSYFHQDYDLMGDSDAEILADFARTHSADEVRRAVAEIDRIMATPVEGLLQRYAEQTGPWDMAIGVDDISALEWLVMARGILAGAADA